MTTATLYDLYRGKVNVWVEDWLTHSVLTELWHDPDFGVIVADGKPAVHSMVRSAPRSLRGKVYGIVDRDFDEDNQKDWDRAECNVLRLPVHEFENLLLDFEVLSALSKDEPADQLRGYAHAHATKLRWWMVCKACLRDIQAELGGGFPGDPPTVGALNNLKDVEEYVTQHSYWQRQDAAHKKWKQTAPLRNNLQVWLTLFEGELVGDGWVESISGKELLRYLRGQVRGLDETPRRPPQPSLADRNLNLGKRIARKMQELGRVPPTIVRIHRVLREKAAQQ
jgi:hypothetical protein